MRTLLAIAALLPTLVACGGSIDASTPDASDDSSTRPPVEAGPGPLDASVEADAGSGNPYFVDGGACNTVPDDAPTMHWSCPFQCDACAPPSGGGGAIQDGTYVLLAGEVFASNCGMRIGESWRGKMVVHGSTIAYVYNDEASDAGAVRENYTFTSDGTRITIKRTCPDSLGPFQDNYAAHGDILALPIGPLANPPYFKRQ